MMYFIKVRYTDTVGQALELKTELVQVRVVIKPRWLLLNLLDFRFNLRQSFLPNSFK